jgi:hypothetical protein
VLTCSTTNGAARPAVASSSAAYTISRDTTVATASRIISRTVPISAPAASVICDIASAPRPRARNVSCRPVAQPR